MPRARTWSQPDVYPLGSLSRWVDDGPGVTWQSFTGTQGCSWVLGAGPGGVSLRGCLPCPTPRGLSPRRRLERRPGLCGSPACISVSSLLSWPPLSEHKLLSAAEFSRSFGSGPALPGSPLRSLPSAAAAAGQAPVLWDSVPAREPVLLLFPICSLSPQNVLI